MLDENDIIEFITSDYKSLNSDPLIITQYSDSEVVFKTTKDNSELEFNYYTQCDSTLKLILIVVLKSLIAKSDSKIKITLLENNSDEYFISSISIKSFESTEYLDGIDSNIFTDSELNSEKYSSDEVVVEVLTSKLMSKLIEENIIRFEFEDEESLVKSINLRFNSIIDQYNSLIVNDKFESKMVSLAGMKVQYDRKKMDDRKKEILNRNSPITTFRKSRSAKIAWRKSRSNYLQGFRLFNKSVEGKRINKMRGKLRSLNHKENNS